MSTSKSYSNSLIMKPWLATLLITVVYLFSSVDIHAQCNTWTQKANFGGTARSLAVGFSIDNKGYVGTGSDGAVSYSPLFDIFVFVK